MTKQVDSVHYEFTKYVGIGRWNSYYYQITECLKYNPKNVLYIGKGDGIVPSALSNLGINVKTFDFDCELKPDYCGDIKEILNIVKETYDVVMCCQVLEHVPFSMFERSVESLKKLTNLGGGVIISLPVKRYTCKIAINLPKVHIDFNKNLYLWKNKEHQFDGEHYWEVQTKQVKYKDVNKIIDNHFQIKKDYIIKENPFHWMIVCRKQ